MLHLDSVKLTGAAKERNGVEEEKIYYKYVGKRSQRQRHLGESRMDTTRLNWAMQEREKKRGGGGDQVQQPGG